MTCTRSHPHDDPCPDHDLRTEIARLTNALAREEAAHMQTLSDRDRYHDAADELTDAISNYLQAEFGEHSSANSPWQNALNFLQNLD